MSVRALSSSLRATGAAAPVQVRTRAGRWASLHAAFMLGTGGVAVVIEAAHPRAVLPLLSAALGLTEREAEVAAAVLRGESTRLIARRLRMAEGTANVHLRAVYSKAGVHSRGELVARALGA
jgi:DNA-binding CsgD family transcriptional regulator